MSGFEEYSHLVRTEPFAKRTVSTSAVRVKKIVVIGIGSCQRFSDLLVVIAITSNVVADSCMRMSVEVENASKIARIADVHSVSNSFHLRLWLVSACPAVVEEHVVSIICRNEAFHGQSHSLTDESGSDIAEITAWHGNDDVRQVSALLCQLGISIEVIEHLRHKTSNVYRICACQFMPVIEFVVQESRLNESLTIVERAIDFYCKDFFAKCSKLRLLNLNDLAGRIQN